MGEVFLRKFLAAQRRLKLAYGHFILIIAERRSRLAAGLLGITPGQQLDLVVRLHATGLAGDGVLRQRQLGRRWRLRLSQRLGRQRGWVVYGDEALLGVVAQVQLG